jgi:protein-disulfide isomerase
MRTGTWYTTTQQLLTRLGRQGLLPVSVVAAAAAIAAARPAVADSNAVLVQVGNHQITQQQVDAKLQLELYNARKAALDQMVNEYLLQQAAGEQKLSVAEYLRRQTEDKAAEEVNEAGARKFYDDNKTRLPGLKSAGSFDRIKDRLLAAMRQQAAQQKRQTLLADLRKQANVKFFLEPPRMEVATAGHPTLGADSAPVTIVEFADFQCPFCRAAESTLKAVRQKYGNRIRLVFADFPLGFHIHAMQAANAARCAGEQGKFWQYHDALFADQTELASADLKATAKKLALDGPRFEACLDEGRYDDAIKKDAELGRKLEVTGTPTFFIDGRPLVGAQGEAKFIEVIDEELIPAKSNRLTGANHNQKKAARLRSSEG